MEIAFALGCSRRDPAGFGGQALPTLREHYEASAHHLPARLSDQAQVRPTRVYLGHEFCERLLPRPPELRAALRRAAAVDLAVTLATPVASDAGMASLRHLLPLLPDGGEVVCNDWGVVALVRREHPHLRAIAGRQLCRMTKDPRLPSSRWAQLYPHGLGAPTFQALLARCAVEAIELDVPPYVEAAFFAALPRPAHVHAPFGYAAKGRSCRIGSLHQSAPLRFAPGHPCQRECLDYRARTARPQPGADLPTVQRGNTMLYGHSAAMGEVLAAAVQRGQVARLVLESC